MLRLPSATYEQSARGFAHLWPPPGKHIQSTLANCDTKEIQLALQGQGDISYKHLGRKQFAANLTEKQSPHLSSCQQMAKFSLKNFKE